MKLIRIPALAAAAVLALSACNDDSTGSNNRGEFSGVVSGEFSLTIDGEALSGASVGFGQDQLILTDESSEVLVYARHLDDEFSEGSEPLASLEDNTGVDAGIIVGERVFLAYQGALDIDELANSGIRGTLSFDAVEIDPDDLTVLDDEVTVDVDFDTRYSSSCCGLFNNRLPGTTARLRVSPAK